VGLLLPNANVLLGTYNIRYGYHENTIIFPSGLSLVGISDCLLLEFVLSIAGTCDLFIIMFEGIYAFTSTL